MGRQLHKADSQDNIGYSNNIWM